MKKILFVILTLFILTGCKNKTLPGSANITYMKCTQIDETLANKMDLEFEFHDNEIYMMRQIQVIEYESEDKALSSQISYDESSSGINDQFEHIKAYTKVEDTNLYLITEHQISKFNNEEKDLIKLKKTDKEGFLEGFIKAGYTCEEVKSLDGK